MTELTANIIAESIYTQYDPVGNQYVLLDDIIDFRKTNSELSIEDQNIVMKGRLFLRHSNFVWKVCCQWKDGSTSWEKLVI